MAEFEGIVFEIKGNADAATGSLREFSQALSEIKDNSTTLSNIAKGLKEIKEAASGGAGAGFKSLVENLNKLATVSKEMEDSYGAMAKVAQALERLSNVKNIKIPKSVGDGIKNIALAAEWISPQAIENVDKLTRSLQRLQNVDLKGVGDAFKAASKGLKAKPEEKAQESGTTEKTGGTLKTLFQNIRTKIDTTPLKATWQLTKQVSSGLRSLGKRIVLRISSNSLDKLKSKLGGVSTVLRSLGRIAFYRLIRSAIKAVTQAFQEGLKNAYAFSAGLSNAIDGRIATALDNLTAKSLTMKNQLGAAFGSLLTALAPIINALIGLITALATALTQLFAAFSGGTFLKAKDTTAKFADDMKKGGGAAKEWKNQLMGFDEINRLEEQGGGGGGGGANALDPNDMFEVQEIESQFKKFVDDLKSAVKRGDWKGVGQLLGSKINSLVASVDWKGFGAKLGYGINGAVQSLYHTLKTINFKAIGFSIASFINSSLEQIDFNVWGRLLTRKLTMALDFLIGFVRNLNWGQIGKAIGDFLRGALDEASEWLNGQDWATIGTTLWNGIKSAIENMDVESIASSLSTFISSAINALTLLLGSIDWASVVETLFGFLADVIRGFSIDDIATAIAGFVATAILEIPSLVLGAISGTTDLLFALFKDMGLDSIAGFFQGISEKVSSAAEWLKENLVDPLVNKTKELLGIHSPSTVFKGIGEDVMAGFKNGMSEKWSEFDNWIKGMWQDFKNWWENRSLANWSIRLPHISVQWQPAGDLAKFFGFSAVPSLFVDWYAKGGFPEVGELFLARENGIPELVGSMGGRNAVANNQQIIEGIKEGVMEAMSVVMGGNGQSNQPIVITLDGREIARTTTKYQNQMARAGAY